MNDIKTKFTTLPHYHITTSSQSESSCIVLSLYFWSSISVIESINKGRSSTSSTSCFSLGKVYCKAIDLVKL